MGIVILHGFLLSLGLILPLGVQNTFVLTQGALHRKWVAALPAVITAALCDGLLIGLAVSGVSLIVLTVPWLKVGLSWAGVIFLAYMGWATWRSTPSAAIGGEEWPVGRQIKFAASVSLLNPHAILDTVAVIGTNSLRYAGWQKVVFAVTCMGVSWVWFLALAVGGSLLGLAASGVNLKRWVNRVSALIMWLVGLQFLWGLLVG